MQIKEITVTAGRTFNNPHESYGNLRPEVVLTATLDEGEDASAATKQLQAQAEGLVEDHKNALLKNLDDIAAMTRRQAEFASLESNLKRTQTSLDRLRKEASAAGHQLTLGEGTDDEDEPTFAG